MKIYGRNSVKEYLNKSRGKLSGSFLICRDEKKSLTIDLEKKAISLGLKVHKISRRELDEKLPGCNHQGLFIKINQPPKAVSKVDWQNTLSSAIEKGEKPRVALLDRVQDPGNLGAIVRSAAQFGISMLFLPKNKAADFTPAARKTACGGDNYVSIIQVNNLNETMQQLKKIGFWVGAACAEGDTKLWDLQPDVPFALILGSEGDGVRRLLLKESDYLLSIPTLEKLDSLNVSVSAGILFYEIFRYDFFSKTNAPGSNS